MAAGTTAIDTALTTEGDADGSELITFEEGTFEHVAGSPEGPLQYIRNHEELAARKLAPPFWGKPFTAATLAALVRELQLLEDTFWSILESRTVENADLVRLKVIGKLVGQPRLRFDLETYRLLIAARGLANASQGRASDLLAILTLLLGEGQYVLLAVGNATLYITALQPIDAMGIALLRAVLPDAVAAGVGLQLLYSDDADPDEHPFIWGVSAWGEDKWGTLRVMS